MSQYFNSDIARLGVDVTQDSLGESKPFRALSGRRSTTLPSEPVIKRHPSRSPGHNSERHCRPCHMERPTFGNGEFND
jgi:hypothetical protein